MFSRGVMTMADLEAQAAYILWTKKNKTNQHKNEYNEVTL